jgi:FtsH-binding integral membrane protein
MAFGTDNRTLTRAEAEQAQMDMGLRSFMLKVYNYMASGLALTGIVAFLTASSPTMVKLIFGSPLVWVVMLAPIGLVFFLSFRIAHIKSGTAHAIFWLYAGLMGLSLASVLLVYTGVSVTRTFFVVAATFGAMSLYGYTTKRDLSGLGNFLLMGLIGILIAGVVNIFLQSSMMHFVISALGVLIFVGLTAYDTQKVKEMYWEADEEGMGEKKAIIGALTLYMDFINLFIYMLQFIGDRK